MYRYQSKIKRYTREAFEDYRSGRINLYGFARRIFEIGDHKVSSQTMADFFYEQVKELETAEKKGKHPVEIAGGKGVIYA